MSNNPSILRIRELILSGELTPGERVTEAGLAERLAVSRTPVRSALPALAKEGLLEPVGQRGYRVKLFSSADSIAALRLRSVIEGLAARVIAERGAGPALKAQLSACLDEGDAIFGQRSLTVADEELYAVMNARFHHAIVTASDTPVIIETIGRLNSLPFVSPHAITLDKFNPVQLFNHLFYAHQQHHAIVQAITARDSARAEWLFHEHIHAQLQGLTEPTPKPASAPAARGRRASVAGRSDVSHAR